MVFHEPLNFCSIENFLDELPEDEQIRIASAMALIVAGTRFPPSY
jgi:hypothetical protein